MEAPDDDDLFFNDLGGAVQINDHEILSMVQGPVNDSAAAHVVEDRLETGFSSFELVLCVSEIPGSFLHQFFEL